MYAIALLVATSTLPADVGRADVLCGYLSQHHGAQVAEMELIERVTRDDGDIEGRLASLERRLERRRLDAEADLLAQACANDGGFDQIRRQRAEAAVRVAHQAACHRDGKTLARIETLLEAGVEDPMLEPQRAFYAQLIDDCIASGVGSAEVRFDATDGGVVHGRLYGTGDHGVILAHGGRFTKESWKEQALLIADAGFLVLAIDFRGRGRSRGPEGAQNDGYEHDVYGAVRYLKENEGVSSVAIVGASFGGGAAAQAATLTERGEIDHLVLLAHSTIDRPESMQGCKLFMVAEDDVRGGGVRRIDEIRDQYERASPPKRLEVLPGAAHAQFLFETGQAEATLGLILDFLKTPC